MALPFFRHSLHRPLVPPRVTTQRAPSPARPFPFGQAVPATSSKPTVTSNLFTTTLDGQDFVWMGANRAEFYRYLRDHVPVISAAI